MGKIPHLLFGHVTPSEPYSVARWLDDARGALAAVGSESRLPVFAGGTGLYFKALMEGLHRLPNREMKSAHPSGSESIGRAAGTVYGMGEGGPRSASR